MVEDEKPDDEVLREDITIDRPIFTFIIDRSGSMGITSKIDGRYVERIEVAREALVLFLRSLPAECCFEIISFGNKFEFLEVNGMKRSIPYSEENVNSAIEAVKAFMSDFGGTNILDPLKKA